jgi:geranylgeranyl diphosphate synthase type II
MIAREVFQEKINSALEKMSFPIMPEELYEPIRYTLSMGGKRMRPQLTLMACSLYSDEIQLAVHPALGIEIFHNFTLLHDDIMDEAPLRRGKATVHTKWNSNIAILSGDVMFVEACRLMSKAPDHALRDVLDVFYKAAVEVCEGQQYDMNFELRSDVTLNEYLEMIRLKTAVLLGAALQIGALCGGALEDDAAHLYAFGCSLGVAFQLMDDILDVYGDPLKFGKQVGGDILANKKTFLSLKAFEKAKGDKVLELKSLFSTREQTDEKVARVTAIFDDLGIRKDAEAQRDAYYQKAISELNALRADESKKEIFYDFAAKLMQRER